MDHQNICEILIKQTDFWEQGTKKIKDPDSLALKHWKEISISQQFLYFTIHEGLYED